MRFALVAAFATSLMAVPASAAPIITFAPGAGGYAAGTTVFQNFDGLATGSSIGTFANVYDVSSSKGAVPAFGSTGNFAAVLGGGTYSVTFDASDIFSFVLGSLDRYNQLTIAFADGTREVYNGGEIINGRRYPAGDQFAPGSNGLVTFDANGGARITGATFRSDTNSFEFDNLAIGIVPEPSTWAMMVLGLGLAGAGLRRRRVRVAFTA